jgi:hypothetical protein
MGIIKLNVKYCLNRRNSTKNAFHIYNSNIALLNKLQKEFHCPRNKDLENLPSTFMICYLNGFEAKQKLIDAKVLLKPFIPVYLSFKEALRILRK